MAELKHSELASKLVIEGALAAFAGTVKGSVGIEPVVMSDREAAQMGLGPGGNTLFYPLSKSGVFIDVAASRTTVWYSGADADRAPQAFDAALKRAYPQAKQVEDKPDERDGGMRIRTYDVKLGDGRMATLEVGYSTGREPKFVVQIVPMVIKN